MITRFADRFEGSLETKDTVVDWYLSIQTTFREDYNGVNEYYTY
jgi:hypothetical protein